jgi:hypothetical protein
MVVVGYLWYGKEPWDKSEHVRLTGVEVSWYRFEMW